MGSLDITKEGYDAFSRGDMAKFMSLCDDDIEWIYYGSVPWAGSFRGHGEVMRFFGILAGALEIRAFGPDEFIVSEDSCRRAHISADPVVRRTLREPLGSLHETAYRQIGTLHRLRHDATDRVKPARLQHART